MGQHALHLACADHSGLIDNEHIAGGEQVAALPPLMLQPGNGARGYPRAVLKSLGSHTREGSAANGIASILPGLARHAKPRALARSGVAAHHAQPALAGHMLACRTLLAG